MSAYLKLSVPPSLPLPCLALRRVKPALVGHAVASFLETSLQKVREKKPKQSRMGSRRGVVSSTLFVPC